MSEKIKALHLERKAVLYIRQSSAYQVIHNEEHLVVETAEADRWSPGDATVVIPQHVCPTVALHAEAVIVSNGEIVGRWPVTARNRRITI